jgi:uncharacterized membrane protein YagU involved in acid resistance
MAATRADLARDIAKGAVAGALATWLMGKVTTFFYELQDARTTERERQIQPKTAYTVAAEKTASVVGASLADAQVRRAGLALHWALGIGVGALYGALRRRVPGLARGRGLALGLGFFVVVDELMNWALGFTPAPTAFPWQTHTRGLAGHVAYGVIADTALDVLDRAA